MKAFTIYVIGSAKYWLKDYDFKTGEFLFTADKKSALKFNDNEQGKFFVKKLLEYKRNHEEWQNNIIGVDR